MIDCGSLQQCQKKSKKRNKNFIFCFDILIQFLLGQNILKNKKKNLAEKLISSVETYANNDSDNSKKKKRTVNTTAIVTTIKLNS